MAKNVSSEVVTDDTSIPYRVVIDFLEGTLRKQDAIAFARGFIETHFDARTASGYYVMPYPSGYIFEVQEGGNGRAYLPGIMKALDSNPAASGCIQMARRVLEVKKSGTGAYTAILLPEGTEPQNPDKVFPEPGPKLIPFQRSGITGLLVGASVFGIGFLAVMFCTIIYLVQVSGLLSAPMQKIDYSALPLTQWESLTKVAGEKSSTYVKTIRYQNGKWNQVTGVRSDAAPDVTAYGPAGPTTNPGTQGAPTTQMGSSAQNPLAPPTVPTPMATPPVATPAQPSLPAAPATLLPPPIATPSH